MYIVMMIRFGLLLYILFSSLRSFSQYSEDLLKNMHLQVDNDPSFVWIKSRHPNFVGYMTMNELFKDYFDSFRVFVLDYKYLRAGSPHYTSQAKLYAFDRKTSKLMCFEQEQSFINNINQAKIKISNLDKCYLYLYLNHLVTTHNIIAPKSFKEELSNGSVFVSSGASGLFISWYPSWNLPFDDEVKSDIASSSNSKIIIYVDDPKDFNKAPWQYSFFFDDAGDLVKVDMERWSGYQEYLKELIGK
jgi:hypothetical protein